MAGVVAFAACAAPAMIECRSVVGRIEFHVRNPELQPSGNLFVRAQQLRRSRNRRHESAIPVQAPGIHRAVDAISVLESDRDQHAASAAEQEVGGVRSLPVPAQGALTRRHRQPPGRIGDIGRPMLAAERAIACAWDGVGRILPGRKFDAQSAAMATAMECGGVCRCRHLRRPCRGAWVSRFCSDGPPGGSRIKAWPTLGFPVPSGRNPASSDSR